MTQITGKMQQTIKKSLIYNLLAISRPRFWSYLAGPFLLGIIFSFSMDTTLLAQRQENLFFILYGLLYFLVPANIILYGVNDIADKDTDAFNTKKGSKEHRLQQKEQRSLWAAITISFVLSLPFFFLVGPNTTSAIALLLAFFFLSFAYSAKPFRWKAKPFIDSGSNVLYILPGIFSYNVLTGTFPAVEIIIAAWSWTIAMHLFSAIPDITSDKKAQLLTTAVFVGKNMSLLLCTAFWTLFASLLYLHGFFGHYAFIAFLYPLIPLFLLGKKEKIIDKIYWCYPIINLLCGFLATAFTLAQFF